jgi:hypothetical protein
MTKEEAFAFLSDEAFISLPGVRAYLIANSKDANLTTEQWAEAITSATVDEARAALARFVAGEIELFAYQFSMFPAQLMGVVRHRRSEDMRRSQSDTERVVITTRGPAWNHVKESDAWKLWESKYLPAAKAGEMKSSDALREWKIERGW